MSLPEVLLWQRLKGSPQGIAFRKQHPIDGYRADFYCAAAKLIVEVDGIAHDMGDRPARDDRRTAAFAAQGYDVLRVPAADVLKDADDAASAIVAYAARPLHQPVAGPQFEVDHAPGMILDCWEQSNLELRERGGFLA